MGTLEVICTVKNTTDREVPVIVVEATFYDKDDKIIGTGLGTSTSIKPGRESTVNCLSVDVTEADHYTLDIKS